MSRVLKMSETILNDPVEKAETKTEDGEEYPASAFAYVPDPSKPSTWKLRLWDSLEEKETRRQIGAAIAALGKGFRGNKVKIPAEDLPRVKKRVLQAWLKVWPNKDRDDAPKVLLAKSSLISAAEVFEDESLLNPNRRAPQRFSPDTGVFEESNGVSQEDSLLSGTSSYDLGEEEVGYQDSMTLLLRLVLQTWLKAHPETASILKGYGWDDEEKGHDYGETAEGFDAMTHLLMAYRLMMDHEECRTLLKPLMRLIHRLEETMLETSPMEEEPEEEYVEETDKEIRQENGQFCVYSTTGRSFGCYGSEQDAINRLEQIERFKLDKLEPTSTKQLVKFHDRLHALKEIGTEHIVVHNLIEDELESRGVAPPYELGDIEKKLEMLNQPLSGITPVIKQDEQRYTLGPVYVPDREDAHGEFTDSVTLQKALWDWVRKGDRRIFIQHSDKVAGEMVETLTWPFPIEVDLEVPNQGITKQTFPADTPFLGVVWEDWAWELVKAGELRGYSIGGRAKRIEADLPEPALI